MIKKPPSAADKEEKEAVVPDDGEGATSSEDAVSFRVDFPRLFSTLSSTLSADESTLLLYLLLHQNAEFRSHVLASSDVEKVSGQYSGFEVQLTCQSHCHSYFNGYVRSHKDRHLEICFGNAGSVRRRCQLNGYLSSFSAAKKEPHFIYRNILKSIVIRASKAKFLDSCRHRNFFQ